MIDPRDITDYDRTDAELEELLLFCAAVTAKTAVVIARQLDAFLRGVRGDSPFDKVRTMIREDTLMWHLKQSKIGQYTRLNKAYRQIVELDPRKCTVDELEQVHGIGPKTARYFLLHSRRNQRVAALDTHMMHYLRDKGYTTINNTPTSKKKYAELEAVFIAEADKSGKTIAEFDLAIWNHYSKFGKK